MTSSINSSSSSSSSREIDKVVTEISEAAKDGIRQCLAVADDLQEEGGAVEWGEALKKELLAAVTLDKEISHIQSAVVDVKNTVEVLNSSELSEEQPNLLNLMEEKLNSLVNEEFDPITHPSMLELNSLLATSLRSEQETAEDDDNDDIQVERVQESLKCPLTGTYLEDPVRNKECGHVFSKVAVLEHMRHRTVARCPVCSGPLNRVNLEPDPRLAKKARRARRKKK